MNIYIAEKNEIHKQSIEKLRTSGHKVTFEIGENNPDIEAIFIRTYTHINSSYLDKFANLNYILRAGVGLDNIDVDECKKRKIVIINSPGSNSNSVAEFVIYFMIGLMRNIPIHINKLKSGSWRDNAYLGQELTNKTIGLVGCGAIGKLIAMKLQPFSIKNILGYDPYLDEETLKKFNIQKVELNEIIANSDIISLHVPLTNETKNLISTKEFNNMKKGSYIINTSRGGIIDEEALIIALNKHIISGAALDVFENEPNINKNLLKIDTIIATPHIAAYTEEADMNMSMQAVENFLKIIS